MPSRNRHQDTLDDDRRTVPTSEAVRLLGVSRTTVQKMFNAGVLQGVLTVGRHRRISLQSIRRLASGQRAQAPFPGRLRVLVAEDNPVMQRLYRRQIAASALPIELAFAGDARAALQAIERAPPDVLITDLLMQPGDGWHLLQQVTADPRLAPMSVAVVTALEPETLVRHAALPAWLPVYTKPHHWQRLEGFLQAQVQCRLRNAVPSLHA